MEIPRGIEQKARRLEELILRVESGESLVAVCVELELEIDEKGYLELRDKYEAGGRSWKGLIDGRCGHPQKANSAIREWLFERKREDESLTAPQLVIEVKAKFGVDLSAGHINYLLRKVELTRPVGRPRVVPAEETKADTASPASLENAGIFFSRRRQSSDEGQ